MTLTLNDLAAVLGATIGIAVLLAISWWMAGEGDE